MYCSGSNLSQCLLSNWLIKGALKKRDVVFIGGLSEELADAVPNVVAQVPRHHHDEEVEHQDEVGYEHHYDGQIGAVPEDGNKRTVLGLAVHALANKAREQKMPALTLLLLHTMQKQTKYTGYFGERNYLGKLKKITFYFA